MIALGFFLRKPTKTNKNRFFPEKTDKNQQKPVFS